MSGPVNAKQIDEASLSSAQRALAIQGLTARTALESNPMTPLRGIAMKYPGMNATGLMMAAFSECSCDSEIRELAKDLLIRDLLDAFPVGWSEQQKVHPIVLISWDRCVSGYLRSADRQESVIRIVNHLALLESPQAGWRPQYPKDDFIDMIFDRYWT